MVAHLTFAEQHDDRASLPIANGVQLGIQSAFCSPDTTGNIPFLSRLAAVRCAFSGHAKSAKTESGSTLCNKNPTVLFPQGSLAEMRNILSECRNAGDQEAD